LQLDFGKILTDKDKDITDMKLLNDNEQMNLKTKIDELNKQVKSLIFQLSAYDNIDLDSHNRLKGKYEVLNQNLEFIKEENKNLKINISLMKDDNDKA